MTKYEYSLKQVDQYLSLSLFFICLPDEVSVLISLLALEHDFLHFLLAAGFLHNPLIDAASDDKPPDLHISSLTNSMHPVAGLLVAGRVPVRFVENDVVGFGKVQAEAASPRREEEDEYRFVRHKAVHDLLSVLYRHGTIQTYVFVTSKAQIVFEYVHHSGHLAIHEACLILLSV